MAHKGNYINTRISDGLHKDVKQYLEVQGLSMSDFLRTAVEQMLAHSHTKGVQPRTEAGTNGAQSLAALERQLDRAGDQLAEKDKQISELHQLLGLAQKTAANLTDQLDAMKQLEDLRTRPTWWQRLVGRNG